MNKPSRSALALISLIFVGLFAGHTSRAEANPAAWRSVLYPENWTPPVDKSFATDKLIQDFSYAGYRRGEEPIPNVTGPIFDVTHELYGADATGMTNSTSAIQKAIDAAASAGGGVVYLPAGTYQVEPREGVNFALRIQDSNIVLRGAGVQKTFLLNKSVKNSPNVIQIDPRSLSYGPFVDVTADDVNAILDKPTRRIPVADAAAFHVGNQVRLVWSFTQDWINEHGQGNWWTAPDKAPSVAQYHREVTAVNPCEGWIELDVPTRYTVMKRDGARLRTIIGNLRRVGLEDFSIGNVEHPGNVQEDPTSGFGDGDYQKAGTAARDAHGSCLISFQHTCDSWITGVHSYQAANNEKSTSHMLSNGISLDRCFRMTLEDCAMRRPQYGGGGGNGYMFRIQSSQEILVKNSVAEFSRHGFVLSHAGTSGNVFLNCVDKETGRATGNFGADGYETGGSGSDHHMHFSHSNLFDSCSAENSMFKAIHRGNNGGGVPAGLTSAHGVYWNTQGRGNRGGELVYTSQGRFGYVIGTSGSRALVNALGGPGHPPRDYVEGVGLGATLEPQSLYADQLHRRLAQLPTYPVMPDSTVITGSPPVGFTLTGAPTGPSDLAVAWSTPPERISIPPFADTFIQGDSSTANANYGTSEQLNLKRASSSNTTRRVLLRFLLCNTDLVQAARLVLTKTSSASYARWRVDVRAITAGTGWTETWVTWNNAPVFGSTLATYEPSPGVVDSIDLTAAVLAARRAGAKSIDLALVVVSQPDDTLLSYHSREKADLNLRPRLELEMLPAITRFETWIAQQPGVAADLRAPLADPDGDGLPNLLEMALGRDPGRPDRHPPLTFEGGNLRFTFSELAPAFTRLQLEESTDLVKWLPMNVSPEHIVAGADGLLHVSLPVSLDVRRRFWRLRLSI